MQWAQALTVGVTYHFASNIGAPRGCVKTWPEATNGTLWTRPDSSEEEFHGRMRGSRVVIILEPQNDVVEAEWRESRGKEPENF